MYGAMILDIVRRGVVKLAASSRKLTEIQAVFASDDIRDAEYFEPYGFTSVPKEGAEALGLSVGTGHTVIVCAADRRYRITGLASGEVAIYDAAGSTITLKSDGRVVIDAAATIELGAGATEALVKGTTFQALYNAHTHTDPSSGVTGPPVVPMGSESLSTVGKVS